MAAVEEGGFASAGRGICEQGNQGPETNPGTPSQPWCLTPNRESVSSATGRAVTRGIAWHGNSYTAIPSAWRLMELPRSITPAWDL